MRKKIENEEKSPNLNFDLGFYFKSIPVKKNINIKVEAMFVYS